MSEGYHGQTQSVCPFCGKDVDADAPGAIYARARFSVPSMGALPGEIEGRGAFFHASCPPEVIGWVRRTSADDEEAYAVRVFSRGDFSLGGAEYRSAVAPRPGDEIEVRMLHGSSDTWGASPLARVRIVSVDQERRVIEAHAIA